MDLITFYEFYGASEASFELAGVSFRREQTRTAHLPCSAP